MVSGATMPTGNVIKSALKHVGLKEGMSTLSSFFLMEKYDKNPLLFADCAVVVSPTAKQLVDILQLTVISVIGLLGERDISYVLPAHYEVLILPMEYLIEWNG